VKSPRQSHGNIGHWSIQNISRLVSTSESYKDLNVTHRTKSEDSTTSRDQYMRKMSTPFLVFERFFLQCALGVANNIHCVNCFWFKSDYMADRLSWELIGKLESGCPWRCGRTQLACDKFVG